LSAGIDPERSGVADHQTLNRPQKVEHNRTHWVVGLIAHWMTVNNSFHSPQAHQPPAFWTGSTERTVANDEMNL
jgi:hypothetical protein